jgi:arginase
LFGWRQKLLPHQTVVVGARSYEPGEVALLARLGVRVITMSDITQRGLTACMDEAVAIATKGTCGYGVSFDLDVIDPRDAPAVGSPEPFGMGAEAAITALRRFADDRRLLGFEFVEYNPSLDDHAGTTASLCAALLRAALTPGDLAGAMSSCAHEDDRRVYHRSNQAGYRRDQPLSSNPG